MDPYNHPSYPNSHIPSRGPNEPRKSENPNSPAAPQALKQVNFMDPYSHPSHPNSHIPSRGPNEPHKSNHNSLAAPLKQMNFINPYGYPSYPSSHITSRRAPFTRGSGNDVYPMYHQHMPGEAQIPGYDIGTNQYSTWCSPGDYSPEWNDYGDGQESNFSDSPPYPTYELVEPVSAHCHYYTTPPSTPPHPHTRSSTGADSRTLHKTFEVETGEDEAYRRLIHRLTEDERRRFTCHPTASGPIIRPTFQCLFPGCGRWLMHRGQLKGHLGEHGMNFKKPYKCTCGAEFGRQVEAARHVDDKKLCLECERPGRKERTGRLCLRCIRDGKGALIGA